MADKLLSYDSCVSIFQSNMQRSFGTTSPVNIISGPKAPQLYSWAGSIFCTSQPSIAFGTIDRWRPDPNDSMPLNHDQWVLWSTGTANKIRIKETEKSKIYDHWSDSLPYDLTKNVPAWVETFISEMKDAIK